MKRFIVLFVWSWGVMAYSGDGFILVKDESPLTVSVDAAELDSRSNDNSIYQLTLTREKPFPHEYGEMALRIGGEKIRFSSGGYHSPRHHTIGARIDGDKQARAVAKFFNIEPGIRQHPGYRLITKFESVKDSFAKGDPVNARLTIQNVGEEDFVFMQGGRQRGARDNQFAFSCQFDSRMLPDIGNPTNFGGIGSFVTIKPGESHSIEVDLTKWFEFAEAGTYFLRGSYYLEILDSAKDHKTIWEDILAGEFTVRRSK